MNLLEICCHPFSFGVCLCGLPVFLTYPVLQGTGFPFRLLAGDIRRGLAWYPQISSQVENENFSKRRFSNTMAEIKAGGHGTWHKGVLYMSSAAFQYNFKSHVIFL